MKFAIPLLVAGALGGCQAVPATQIPDRPALNSQFAEDSPEWRGQKFARNRCADCHSVDYSETSPLPDAPSFAAIANMPDLAPATLTQWLKDHGNYPNEMYFEIPAENIDDLVAYMITLRRPEATPPR